jgi:hypothetical protein
MKSESFPEPFGMVCSSAPREAEGIYEDRGMDHPGLCNCNFIKKRRVISKKEEIKLDATTRASPA